MFMLLLKLHVCKERSSRQYNVVVIYNNIVNKHLCRFQAVIAKWF